MSNYIWDNFLGLVIVTASVSLSVFMLVFSIGLFVGERPDRVTLARFFGLLLGLATIGVVSGYSGGLSREAAVGDIIPAALALLGGVAAFLFGVDQSRGFTVSVCAICFGVSLHFGFGIGADERVQHDNASALRTYCFSTFTDADLVSNPDALAFHRTIMGNECAAIIAYTIVKSTFVDSDYQEDLARRARAAFEVWSPRTQ